MSKPKIIGVVGPTASGKTDYAISLALRVGGEVVSCDSMQVYRHMDIGTAKPTPEEMQGVAHHMIDILEPYEDFSVARYAEMARRCIDDILSRGRVPILCGGTGLYFDSTVNNIEFKEIAADLELRKNLSRLAAEEGNERVHALLREADPKAAESIHPNNLKRVIRALEIYKQTGRTKTELDREQRGESIYDAEVYGMNRSRSELYSRINRRVDIMLRRGLLDEVKKLLDMGVPINSTAMQAIGYKELAAYIGGEIRFDEAVEKIKTETRRYAKRQLTWFKKNKNIIWLDI
ncbi:MAG TPA: tRNA (adenosine(37)-N6)-dimethylallyltransferase MiaA [Candidatus Monoglobus merdigallinarum]|uniref:tRNA dimethylallyltransferase n=1 Tax=Candidatus Monoglobus merdigallinarum TaxID=2838698 RepID=A0A9D1PQS1_9FIRM|nr:tRNA (adenosine(37)-N6)-dimethylallyltransferase MiaA [Candidatus Monoglobus merdigallinarum]